LSFGNDLSFGYRVVVTDKFYPIATQYGQEKHASWHMGPPIKDESVWERALTLIMYAMATPSQIEIGIATVARPDAQRGVA
jgi:hypothetical protein